MLFVERQDTIIEHLRSRNRRFGGVPLRLSHFAVGIHIGLLIDPAKVFECADIIRILRTQVARVRSGQSIEWIFARTSSTKSEQVAPPRRSDSKNYKLLPILDTTQAFSRLP